MKKAPAKGFTLLELIMTVAVAAALAGFAVPNLSLFLKNNRLTAVSNDLLRSFQHARSEAIKRQQNVLVCASSNGSTCSYGDFSRWIVFVDADSSWQHENAETLLESHVAVDSSVTVNTDQDGIQGYGASGFSLPTGAAGKIPTREIAVCDSRGNQVLNTTESTARAVRIETTGRARVSRLYADVTAAGNCT